MKRTVFILLTVILLGLAASRGVYAYETANIVSPTSSYSSIRQFLDNLEDTTDIPTVCVYTKNNAEVVSRNDYVRCEVYTVNCDKVYKLDGASAGIRVRGNSTAYEGNVEMIRANQVPYRIKFDKKRSMFGLNSDAKCKSWVLLKAEYDLLKNDFAFRFGRNSLRNGNFCSDGILVHVYLNGKFAGIYELCEQHQVNQNRVDIYETPEGYEGIDTGYFVELDNRCEEPFFKVDYDGNPLITDIAGTTKNIANDFYTIKSNIYSNDQKQFIAKYINNCFKILYRACEKGKYYVFDENYDLVKAGKKTLDKKDSKGNPIDPTEIVADMAVDLDSFVDLFLVYELTNSCDVGEGSFFMYADFSDKNNIKKLTFTCPWDFEWSMMGNTTISYAREFNDEKFAQSYGDRSNPWFVLLIKQDWFMEKVQKRWTALRTPKGKKKISTVEKCINQERALLKKYKKDLCKGGSDAYYSAEGLLTWIEKRIKWMDKEYLLD